MVVTKSGNVKGYDPDDWTWWHETVPVRLRRTLEEGFELVVITNQGRLTTTDGAQAPEAQAFQAKIHAIFETLNLPVAIYAACANDNWRKPRIRAWEHFTDSLGLNRQVDKAASYIVGDAAGRPSDHSDDDRHFAMNLEIGFYTPENTSSKNPLSFGNTSLIPFNTLMLLVPSTACTQIYDRTTKY